MERVCVVSREGFTLLGRQYRPLSLSNLLFFPFLSFSGHRHEKYAEIGKLFVEVFGFALDASSGRRKIHAEPVPAHECAVDDGSSMPQ